MESKIGWIDFSPSQKDRVKRFIDMIDAGGMLDELGVGVIRDSISNEIFPGFSTLYTRAKYFFITPYILLDWYRSCRNNNKQDGVEYFNEVERKVNKNISDYFKNLSDKNDESYFGKRTGGKLSRLPSEVYWNGIKRLKLVDSVGSLEQLLNQKPYAINELCSNERGNGVVKELGELGESSIVHVTPFPGWKDFINEHGLTLQEGEAETLKQHLLDNVPDSLPALLVSDLVSDSGIWKKYKEVKGKRIESNVLNNPMICFIEQVHSEIANSTLKENLIQAHNFSLFMYGPHIAYNISLRNKFGGETRELIEKGRLWFKSLNDRMIGDFKIEECPGWGKLKLFTREYLGEVQKMISEKNSWDAIEERMCNLAVEQEKNNKRNKSRFENDNNIDVSREYGLGLINYRYHAVLSVVDDIYNHIASK